jgi:hypothetical protein
MRFSWLVLTAAMLCGCAAPHQIRDRSDFLAEAQREYPGETRERLITAAETVLKISDPADFEFRHTLAGFTGLRRYFIYAVLAAAEGREKWEFTTEQLPNGVMRAAITVSEAGTTVGGNSSTPYEGQMASIPLYRLFWARVEYVLGRRSDWITCDEAAKPLQASNTNAATALGGLCGGTSNGRDAPAPDQLPPIRVAETPKAQPLQARRRP